MLLINPVLKSIVFLSLLFFKEPENGNRQEATEIAVNVFSIIKPGEPLRLTINGESQQSIVKETAARFRFQKKFIGPVRITIAFKDRNWETNASLNGISFIKMDLAQNGISVLEFAELTLRSKNGSLDMWINGESEGTTPPDVIRTVEPGVEHTIEWKRNGATKCDMKVTLDSGNRRIYTCDTSNGKISEG